MKKLHLNVIIHTKFLEDQILDKKKYLTTNMGHFHILL